MAANEKRTTEIIVNGQKANASINEMRAAVKVLNNQLNKLPQGSAEFVKKSEQFKKVSGRLKEVNAEAKSVKKNLDDGAASTGIFQKGINGMNGAMNAAMKSFIALFAVQKLIEFGQELLNIESQVTKLQGTVQRFSGLTGDALSEASANVQALATTFEKSNDEIAQSANVLSKQMGVSYSEALTLIEKGFLAGADASGEFLDQVKEYAPQFKAAGASAEDLITTISTSVEAGIFSDKGVDTVKEFGLRIREQTTATKDAMNDAFGKEFTKELFDGINDGSITTVDALKKVSKGLNDTAIPANKLQTVVADVFGGAGEDAGLDYLKSLENINGELDSLIDTTNGLTQAQMSQLALEKELALVEQEIGKELAGSNSAWNQLTGTLELAWKKGLLLVLNGIDMIRLSIRNTDATIAGFKSAFLAGIQAIAEGAMQSLGGLTDIITGIFTLDIEKIKDGFLKGNSITVMSGIAQKTGEAYSEAFYDALSDEEKQRIREEELQKQADYEASIAQQAAQKVVQVQDNKTKELQAKQKKAADDRIKAEKALQDLRLAVMDEGLEKEIEKENLATQRKIEALVGSEQQITEQKLLLEQERELRIQELKQAQREQEAEAEAERLALSLEEQEIREEEERLALEEKFLNFFLTEEQYEQSVLDLKREAFQAKLDILKAAGKEETLEYKRLQNEKAKIDQEEVENQKRFAQAKKEIKESETEHLMAAGQTAMGLVGAISDMQKAQGKEGKVTAKAAILLQSGLEIARIWSGASTLGPILGPILGAAQTAAALIRTRNNIKQVDSQKFAVGGYTDIKKAVGGYAHINRQNLAQGGMVMGTTTRLITGEAGAEWVAPNWMLNEQPYADFVGMMEAARVSRLATGGISQPSSGSTGAASIGNQTSGANQILEQAAMQQQLLNEIIEMKQLIAMWPTLLKVVNQVQETEEGIQVLNQIRNDANIS